MDIKLKNSKRFSSILAVILVFAMTVGFMAFYPGFKEQASRNRQDPLRSTAFLERLYQSNLVLYRSLLQKTGQESTWQEILLRTEKVKLSEEEIDQHNFEWDSSATEMEKQLGQVLESVMDSWEVSLQNELAKNMDYCIIDHSSGALVKNTGREIETLAQESKETETADGIENTPSDENQLLTGNLSSAEKTSSDESTTFTESVADYVYYVCLDYDGAGNLKSVSVKDQNPDELLKNVQSVMESDYLQDTFMEYTAGLTYYTNPIYLYGQEGAVQLSYRLEEAPRDVTCIYALTAEQRELLCKDWQSYDFLVAYRAEEVEAYYQMGANGIFCTFLLVLALAAVLLTRWKKYTLHHREGCQLHLEISLTGIVLLMCMASFVIYLVSFTNGGYFDEFYKQYLTFLPRGLYSPLTLTVNFLLLAAMFGLWYWFFTSLGEVFDLGIWRFLKERSLILQLFIRIKTLIAARRRGFQEELLHADLGEKIDGTLKKVLLINYVVLAVISFTWTFGWLLLLVYTAVLYVGSRKYIANIQKQYRQMLQETDAIAEGNLNTRLCEDPGIFQAYQKQLNRIREGFQKAVEEEVKSQRMKTELITNVSHDLKTPLTAIITYIELLEKEDITKEQQKEYLEVLSRKAARLKFLIEDLFEVSKATTGNVKLELVEVDICNLLRQVYLEHEEQVEAAQLIFRFDLPEEKILLRLDSQKTYRIFENLYVNIIKYAMPRSRAYVTAERTDTGVRIVLKNISATELNHVKPEELTERFVRGDSSRTTEGSGLGLAIAKSFAELQGGRMQVEIDGDLFKVTVEWEDGNMV